MRQRNITEAEVREVLAQPLKRHVSNEIYGTMNVTHEFPNLNLTITVAYDAQRDPVHIVTVIDECRD